MQFYINLVKECKVNPIWNNSKTKTLYNFKSNQMNGFMASTTEESKVYACIEKLFLLIIQTPL